MGIRSSLHYYHANSLNLSENTVNYVTNFFLTDDPGSEYFLHLRLCLPSPYQVFWSWSICILGAAAHALLEALFHPYDPNAGAFYAALF